MFLLKSLKNTYFVEHFIVAASETCESNIPYLLERAPPSDSRGPPPPPFWREIFDERLPRTSAPLFSQKERLLEI